MMDFDTTDSAISSPQRSKAMAHRANVGDKLEDNESNSEECSLDVPRPSTSIDGKQGSGGFLRRRSSNSNSVDYTPSIYKDSPTSMNNEAYFIVNRGCQLSRERESYCTSPVTALVGSALKQMNLKRSSSAPMINQLGISKDCTPHRFIGLDSQKASTNNLTPTTVTRPNNLGSFSSSPSVSQNSRETPMEIDASAFATSFLASLNNPRPRRFSASFSPSSPGPAPSRVSQLRHESNTDWETASEKEFIGTSSITQSWEDLSLDSMSMDVPARRASISEQLWLSINPGTSSASSSPAASPRILSSRFSPAHSSPSPTRRSFTTRRSLSPIAVRPSVLSIASGIGMKRKSDWDSSSSNSNQMDCSPQPAAKRPGGLLSWSQQSPYSGMSGTSSGMSSPIASPLVNHQLLQCQLTSHGESPNSLDTGTESSSSISGVGDMDSPFFRPVDSPINTPSDVSSHDSSHKS